MKAEPAKSQLLVIGSGMVSSRFCEHLVSSGAIARYTVRVLGEEPRLAYNRVRLSGYLEHREAKRLELLPPSWYESHDIQVETGARVESVDIKQRRVTTANGDVYEFDRLVFATGSSPFVPPVKGTDLPSVFVYRTINDLEAIIQRAGKCRSGAVIGGGLLGLEAAHGLRRLGVSQIHIIELSKLLLSRQLNQPASELLKQEVISRGYEVRLGAVTRSIAKAPRSRLRLAFENDNLDVDMVVISAGIRPNSELADAAGLECGVRGGIVVDEYLETSAPGIYAIGECALSHGQIYGLVAPGYQMAETLAHNLAHNRTPKSRRQFATPDVSTKLKMIGVDVTLFGEYLQPGRMIEYRAEGVYRALTFDAKDHLSGAIAVGEWDEASVFQAWIERKHKLTAKQERRFLETGKAAEGAPRPVTAWPDSAVVCNCLKITAGQIRQEVQLGAGDAQAISQRTGASSVCGSCRPLLETLAGNVATETSSRKPVVLLALSCIAILAGLMALILPGPSTSESVQSFWHELSRIWRNSAFKQSTGFTLLGVCAVGLIFSFRKRIPRFSFGKFAHWRLFHVAFGVTALAALFAHTGFSLGHNLNFWLMLSFIVLNLLGAGAGVVSALEGDVTGRFSAIARRWRRPLIWSHIVLFWPFPILLTFHILSVYFY